jgi:signal transduction histidine kinase
LRSLEKRSDQQRTLAEEAERTMRQLSQRVVAVQEEERKNLSRELHDEVAQVLTALRMEISRIERFKAPSEEQLGRATGECRKLVDGMFATVKNLTLGLRPSMLDDFGLEPALEWYARDVTGRYGVNVDLQMSDDFDSLPERHRTCIYRVVQEALTNCVRHAQARSVTVSVTGCVDHLTVRVGDDGVGVDRDRRHGGFGLRGMEERARELDGNVTLVSTPNHGTVLTLTLPLPVSAPEVPVASVAS